MEVCYFYLKRITLCIRGPYDNIVRLNVPVDNIVLVNVADYMAELL